MGLFVCLELSMYLNTTLKPKDGCIYMEVHVRSYSDVSHDYLVALCLPLVVGWLYNDAVSFACGSRPFALEASASRGRGPRSLKFKF